MEKKARNILPSPGIAEESVYHVPRPLAPIRLFLDGNEGLVPRAALLQSLKSAGVGVLRSYPSVKNLEKKLSERFGLAPEQVIVTAGADDALDRLCRAVLAPGRELILPEPTFEMIRRYARIMGATIRSVPWLEDDYPIDGVLKNLSPKTALVAVVSPNNPTGGVITKKDLQRISEQTSGLVLLDHAYVEFADEDLTAMALSLGNVVVVRTFSKAWGLAGVRVGYALGPKEVIEWLRISGNPYSVAGPSALVASKQFDQAEKPMKAFVKTVRSERTQLQNVFKKYGIPTMTSQGNFVFLRAAKANFIRDGLASFGISVRSFPNRESLKDSLRLTCPGDKKAFQDLLKALDVILSPEALFFDLDGVLADVSHSYRQAILETVRSFGGKITPLDIAQAKAKGNANNDWVLSRRFLAQQGIRVGLKEVTRVFEEFYQGTPTKSGLRTTEKLLFGRDKLSRLAKRLPLAVVTGRPRTDAERFLEEQGISDLFKSIICMEDAPLKPDPKPVKLALKRLRVKRAWMIGDAPDDMRSACGAGVLALAVLPPGDPPQETAEALLRAGGGRILANLHELEECLP